jgi:hypothetical protein
MQRNRTVPMLLAALSATATKVSRPAILARFAGAAILLVTLAPAGCKGSNTITGPNSVTATPTIPAGYTVSGTVSDFGGNGVANASVSVSSSTSPRATTAADGSYSISGIPAGTVTVHVTHVDYRPATTQVTLPPSATGVDFHLRGAS